MRKTLYIIFTIIIFGYSSSQSFAEKRQLESHEHGVSKLQIVIEKNIIQYELEAPANDIVGFENSPKNEQQKESMNKAINLFKNTDGLFTTSSKANCRSSKIDIEFEVEGTHAGFHAKWNSKCKKISELKELTTMFFQIFPKAEELEVQIISEKSQSAIEWESDTKTIKIPKIHN